MYERTIEIVRDTLALVFAALDEQLTLPPEVRQWKMTPESWSISEIGEHVSLTSYFLLLTIQRSTEKAVKRSLNSPILPGESDLEQVRQIGHPDAFPWLRPEHMEPTGKLSHDVVRQRLQEQYGICLALLNRLPDGIGTLHTVRMSVQNLARLDIYQWLYFLAMHTQRHVIEIQRIQQLYQQSSDKRRIE